MNTFREGKIAFQATRDYPDIPVYVSFTCNEDGLILGGDSWEEIDKYFANKVDIILVNCSSLESSVKAIKKIKSLNVEKWGVYPNFGEIDNIKGWNAGLVENTFKNFLKTVIKLNPSLLGTCCGATPVETFKLKSLIDQHTK